jgi:hypothetical protein
MIPVLTLLATEIGLPLAKKIFSSLSEKKGHASKIDKVSSMINSGSTAMSAFSNVFGTDFQKAMTAVDANRKLTHL